MVDDVGHEVSESDVRAGEERRWPAWVALFAVAWAPGTTARRTSHVGLLGAFGVHLLSALLLGLVLCWLMAWEDGSSCVEVVERTIEEIQKEYKRDPAFTSLVLLMGVVVVEAGMVLMAILVAPWGARDEPVLASVKSALRWTWLHSSHAVLATLLIGVVVASTDQARRDWNFERRANMPRAPQPPTAPVTTDESSSEWQDYEQARKLHVEEMAAYRAALRKMWDNCPWEVKHADRIIGYVGSAVCIWWFGTLLYGVGVRRAVRSPSRPPLCSRCGYNLTHASLDGRCSECGENVATSIGPLSRRGSAWELRDELGIKRAWWLTGMDAIRRPREFGMQLSVSRPCGAHRSFLIVHLVLIFVVAWLGSMACVCIAFGWPSMMQSSVLVWEVGPVCGCTVSLGLLLLSLLLAFVVGLWFRWSDGRNLLPAAMQGVSYLSLYILLWVIFNCLIGSLALALFRWGVWLTMQRATGVDDEYLAVMSWILPNVVFVFLLLRKVVRITSGARWANS